LEVVHGKIRRTSKNGYKRKSEHEGDKVKKMEEWGNKGGVVGKNERRNKGVSNKALEVTRNRGRTPAFKAIIKRVAGDMGRGKRGGDMRRSGGFRGNMGETRAY